MFHRGREYDWSNGTHQQHIGIFTKYGICIKTSISRFYSAFMLFLLLLNSIRMLLIFRDITSTSIDLIMKITALLWIIISVIQCASMHVIGARRKNNMWHCCNKLQSVRPETRNGLFSHIHRNCNVHTIVAWIILTTSFVFTTYLTWFT